MPSRVRPPKRDPKPVRPPKPQPTPTPAPETEAAPVPGGMRPTDRIIGSARGDAGTVRGKLAAWGTARVAETEAYVAEVFRIAPAIGIDPAIVLGQWHLESDSGRSPHWRDKLNPGGIGVTDGGDVSIDYRTGANAARGQLLHLWSYATTAPVPPILTDYLALDPRFKLVQRGSGQTILGLQGRWATDPQYAAKLCARGNLIWPGLPGQTPTPTPEPDPTTDPYAVMFGDAPYRMGDFGWLTPTQYNQYAYGVNHGTTAAHLHTGQDVMAAYGTPYSALGPGKVLCVGEAGVPLWDQGCGAFADVGDAGPGSPSLGVGNVTILYDVGVKVTTGHTRQAFVKPGDRVTRGQKIGTVGGMRLAHLHVDTVVERGGTYLLIDPADGLRRVIGGGAPAPKPSPPRPTTKPNMTKGLVPMPPFAKRLITNKPPGVGYDNLGLRDVWGLSRHRMQGTLWGTDGYFRQAGVRALTDLGLDHQTGEMLMWCDPFGGMTPWASGPISAPYGDGAAFIAKWQARYGPSVVNRMRVSLELAGFFAQPGTSITADSPWSDLSKRRFAQAMAHYAHDYGIAWSDFPNHPNDGFSFLCDHIEFTKGTGKVCPGPLAIAQTGNVIQLAVDILKAAQAGSIRPPVPPPGLTYPDGMDRDIAARQFGRVDQGGVPYAFDERGPVSRLWLDLGITHEPHLFPELERVEKGAKGEYFFFGNGMVIYRKDAKSAFRTVGDDPMDTERAA